MRLMNVLKLCFFGLWILDTYREILMFEESKNDLVSLMFAFAVSP